MSSHRGTILLVEDDPDLRNAHETVLHRAGYDVIATGDGLRAVELADEHEPTVALVDLLLPGQSGFRVTDALKAQFGDRVRILIMSGNASAAHQNYAVAVGAELFAVKPFTNIALLDAVDALCLSARSKEAPRPRAKIGV